jgi:hypothetical protein
MGKFNAKLSSSLFILTAAVVSLLLYLVFSSLAAAGGEAGFFMLSAVLVFIFTAMLSVREYEINDSQLIIRKRGGWSIIVELSGLESVKKDTDLIWKSVSVLSTKGIFGINGYLWNSTAGMYKAYISEPSRLVLLELSNGKKIAVSPADPNSFIHELKEKKLFPHSR